MYGSRVVWALLFEARLHLRLPEDLSMGLFIKTRKGYQARNKDLGQTMDQSTSACC